jgi:hypothetical protein
MKTKVFTGGEDMKLMNYKTLAILFALTLVLNACGKGEYRPIETNRPESSTEPAAPAVDPITNFNTVWIAEESNPVLNSTHKRTLANFFGFNTVNMAKKKYNGNNGCDWGYKGATTSSECFAGPYSYYIPGPFGGLNVSADPLSNYFKSNSTVIQFFPAPKDLGTVSNYRIRFAADVHDNTRKVIPGSAYIDIRLVSSADVLSVKFTDTKLPLNVTNDTTCNVSGVSVDCDKLNVTFQDDCGDLTFTADLVNGDLKNPKITFMNSASSYKNPGCYSNRILPNNAVKANNSIPSTAPEGIHTSSGRGELFQTVGIVDLVEQL